VPIPAHMDLYHLREEAEPTDRTALEAVVDHIKEELARLNVRRGSEQLMRACASHGGSVAAAVAPAAADELHSAAVARRRWRRRS